MLVGSSLLTLHRIARLRTGIYLLPPPSLLPLCRKRHNGSFGAGRGGIGGVDRRSHQPLTHLLH